MGRSRGRVEQPEAADVIEADALVVPARRLPRDVWEAADALVGGPLHLHDEVGVAKVEWRALVVDVTAMADWDRTKVPRVERRADLKVQDRGLSCHQGRWVSW